jgi:RNA-directed DNA polymerase
LGVYTSRRRLNLLAFLGLSIHVCKVETLHEAYRMAKSNKAAPGIDEVTFEAIGESGEECFLRQIRDELVTHTCRPMREPQHRNGPPLLCYNVYT